MTRSHKSLPMMTLLTVGLVLASAPTAANAGILDSIKSLFGGGSSSSSGNEKLDSALKQVELSQKSVAESQQALTSYYNDPNVPISADDTELKSKLDTMEQASRSNEQLYLQFLQMRGDAKKSGTDLKDLEPRIEQISSTQDQLETNYQRIQEANRQSNLFEPPPPEGGTDTTQASGILASGTARNSELSLNSWMDPEVQGYIDEWLSVVGLNKWGQRVGRFGNTIVTGNNRPGDAGMFRHEIVFRMLLNERKGPNMTLKAFVEARMRGENPDLQPGGGHVNPSVTAPATLASSRASTTSNGTPAATVSSTSDSTASLELAEMDKKLQTSRKNLETMVATGKGSSEEAKSLLDQISSLERDLRNLKEQINRE